MRYLLLTIAALLAVTPLAAQPTAALAPAPKQEEGFFRQAILTLENRTSQTVQAVRLQPVGGGPTIFWPCVVPASAKQDITVPLPALSTSQPYAVALLAAPEPLGTPFAETTATITWPAELVRREMTQADVEPVNFPAGVKRNAMLLMMFALLAMAGSMLIRRRGLRLILLAVVVAGTMSAAGIYLHRLSDVREVRIPGQGTQRPILAVSALRSTTWQSHQPLVPLYQTMGELRGDRLIIHPDHAVYLPLQAGQTRLFRAR